MQDSNLQRGDTDLSHDLPFLGTQEINRLADGLSKSSREEKPASSSPPHLSTVVEVRKISQENGTLIYASEKMHRVKEMVDQVANTDFTVLIQGESPRPRRPEPENEPVPVVVLDVLPFLDITVSLGR